jgi:hypothetical protein
VTDPFTPEEQALIELSAWFDDLPWRIAAGELDPDDCEPPDELLAAWPGDLDELFEAGLPDNYGDVEPDEDAEVHDVTAPTPPGSGAGWGVGRPGGGRCHGGAVGGRAGARARDGWCVPPPGPMPPTSSLERQRRRPGGRGGGRDQRAACRDRRRPGSAGRPAGPQRPVGGWPNAPGSPWSTR